MNIMKRKNGFFPDFSLVVHVVYEAYIFIQLPMFYVPSSVYDAIFFGRATHDVYLPKNVRPCTHIATVYITAISPHNLAFCDAKLLVQFSSLGCNDCDITSASGHETRDATAP
jgi:hypothetical protein